MALEKRSEQLSKNTGQLGGRLRRYARVTSTMGGLAARVAGDAEVTWTGAMGVRDVHRKLYDK